MVSPLVESLRADLPSPIPSNRSDIFPSATDEIPPAPPPEATSLTLRELQAPLRRLFGVGDKNTESFQRLGLQTIGDLLWYLPAPVRGLFHDQTHQPAVVRGNGDGTRGGSGSLHPPHEAGQHHGSGGGRRQRRARGDLFQPTLDRRPDAQGPAPRPLRKNRPIPWAADNDDAGMGISRAAADPHGRDRPGLLAHRRNPSELPAAPHSQRRYPAGHPAAGSAPGANPRRGQMDAARAGPPTNPLSHFLGSAQGREGPSGFRRAAVPPTGHPPAKTKLDRGGSAKISAPGGVRCISRIASLFAHLRPAKSDRGDHDRPGFRDADEPPAGGGRRFRERRWLHSRPV